MEVPVGEDEQVIERSVWEKRKERKGVDNLVKFDIVGSSNGLVCLLGLFPLNIVLWNPATKEAKVVPESHVSYPQGGAQIRDLGFGFDVKTNEYKVVKISEIYDRNPKLTYYDLEFVYEAKVYCLSTDSWREVSTSVPVILFHVVKIGLTQKGCFLGGQFVVISRAFYHLIFARRYP